MKEKNKKTSPEEAICPMCFNKIASPGYFGGFIMCSSCCSIIKTPFTSLSSIEMRKLGIFISFWAGRKEFQEQLESRREIRVQKKMEAKLSQTIK